MMKRTLDIAASAAGLLCLGWLILLLAAMIRGTSAGPGIFVQERVGRHQKRFVFYKLRTMQASTPSAPTHDASAASVTNLGRWLRRLKLDELPQLWNVLKGDMSLVGPRPCLPVQAELIEERRKRGVFDMRPGITGLAQIAGVDMSDPARLAEIDARYATDRDFAGDVVLILKTVTGSGAGDRIRS